MYLETVGVKRTNRWNERKKTEELTGYDKCCKVPYQHFTSCNRALRNGIVQL